MAIRLNHTIVAARDKNAAAMFLTEVLGLPAPEIAPQNYAFLLSEIEFDEIFGRIRARRLSYWADPGREERDQINTWHDGRGVNFDDPNGHLLEIITRPYGSDGTAASRAHPLVARMLEPEDESVRSGSPEKIGGARLAVEECP